MKQRCPLKQVFAFTWPFDSIWAMLCEREGFSATSKTVHVMLLSESEASQNNACWAYMLQVDLEPFCIRMCLHNDKPHALPQAH